MKTTARRPFLERFTILLTVWTGFLYMVLFSLRVSHRMLVHQDLLLVVFGPAAVILVALAAYEWRTHRQ